MITFNNITGQLRKTVTNGIKNPFNINKSTCDTFNDMCLADLRKGYLSNGLSAFGIIAENIIKFFKPFQFRQLSENIEFKEAKTIEEAIQFAQKNFGIKLEIGNELFTANMINEICTFVSNKMKGKVALPDKFIIENNSDLKQGRVYKGAYLSLNNCIYINKEGIAGNLTVKSTNEKLSLSKWLNGLVQRGNKYSNVLNDWAFSEDDWKRKAIKTMSHCIIHELGHCNHFAKNKIDFFMNIFKIDDFIQRINQPKINEICTKFFSSTNYSKNPLEFIADTFVEKILDRTIPKEIDDIYKKYLGPEIFCKP